MDGTVGNREEGDEKERLYLLGNRIPVNIFYGFIDYRQLSSNNDRVDAIIMQFARSDSWAATVLISLEYRKNVVGIEKNCTQTLSQVI